jgi:RHH-type proline utilization regulon transcriptional repressor/proline dehydrogenase/delta 1-pyrroline-5-carboxylate dehydrogenase
VAQLINRTLARRGVDEDNEIPLIAETGGQNALIVDSSALPEQVVQDVMTSAFDSAGQRCSALRVLFLQQDIADKTIRMLKGAMQELRVGVPDRLATDIGPVIDAEARNNLQDHIDQMKKTAKAHFELALAPEVAAQGTFIAPTVFEIGSLAELTRDETIEFITSRAHVGNIYVNRNIVGAVVGVQPFGGEGKSGTGPKAGGPLYIKRLQKGALPLVQHERKAAPGLDALLEWARTHGQERVLTLAEQ